MTHVLVGVAVVLGAVALVRTVVNMWRLSRGSGPPIERLADQTKSLALAIAAMALVVLAR